MIKTNTIKTYNLTAMALPFVLTFVLSPEQLEQTPDLNAVTDQVHAYLDQIDQDFSTFKPTSLVSRYQRGELAENEFTEQFKDIMTYTTRAESMTDGAFNPYFAGKYDPTGMVKGWAIEHAFEAYLEPLLRTEQVTAVVLNGAGDMKVGVMESSDFEWNIGIADPTDNTKMIYQLDIQNGAIATSGMGDDGQHIQPLGLESSLKQATIISDNLIDADILAVAAVAMGRDRFIAYADEYDANGLLVDDQLAEIEL